MTISERIAKLIKDIDDSLLNSINFNTKRKAFIEKIKPQLEALPDDIHQPEFCGTWIDFNYLSHADTIKVVKHFPGKWKKSYDGDAINYTLDLTDGCGIRIYRGEPPPNCKIVEEEYEVPAQPAHKATRKVIKCQAPDDVLIEPEGEHPAA